jgi:hypothetical protein
MAALGWLLNLGLAGGVSAGAPAAFGDLTTLFVAYVQAERNASALSPLDSTTLVMLEQPTIRTNDVTDLNTAYARELS